MPVLHKNAQSEILTKKARLFGLGVKEQCEALNKIYNGDLVFTYTTNGIRISSVNKKFNIIEIPEVDNLDIENLFELTSIFGGKVVTVKLPKCLKSINIARAHWIKYISRLFLWDSTDIDFTGLDNERRIFSDGLEMIAVQSCSGKKPKLYRF